MIIIAAVSVVLAGESPAGAAVVTHSPHAQRIADKRNIRYERLLRDIRNPGRVSRTGRRPAVRPWTITVPSIGVATDLMTLGDPVGGPGPDGLSLPVPPLAKAATAAGWYQFTAVPGAAGNAVIAGHVDTYVGPAVFYGLYLLRPGDRVYVNAGGARQRFDVTSVRELPKPDFPVSQVFGSTTKHMLWLITCGGAFDYETGHYLSNIVVSATWIPPAKTLKRERASEML
jgi:LPXTG-site transpeptidase (sortase) family protein